MEDKLSNQNNPPEKTGVFGRIGKILDFIDGCCSCLTLLLGFIFIGLCCALYFTNDEKPKPEPRPKPQNEDWHGATNLTEIAHRILVRLEDELVALGIDGSNVVANAKANPQRLFRPVPESENFIPRLRLLVLSDEDEAKISRKHVAECRNMGLLADSDTVGLERVRRIVARLLPVIPQIEAEPDVHLLRDDDVNACCLPDGTIFVNTGTLSKIPSDDFLAAILAHELGHAAARHGNERISRALKVVAAGVAFEEGMADLVHMLDSDEGVSLIRLVYGLGSTAAYTRPRDRRMEAEADHLGTRYLARAGFSPDSMLQFFEWLETVSAEETTGLAALLRTHPFHSERADHVREVLAEPDLHEMPQDSWRDKAKAKADEMDFSDVKTRNAISNAMSRLPKIPKVFHKKSQQSPADASDGCSERQENQDTKR